MRRASSLAVVTVALFAACSEDPGSSFEPVDRGRPIVASLVELEEVHELAADPYLAELVGTLEADDRVRMEGALTTFGAGVPTAPHRSYQQLESALRPFNETTRAPSDESDALVALEVLDLYRAWSESTLYGTEH